MNEVATILRWHPDMSVYYLYDDIYDMIHTFGGVCAQMWIWVWIIYPIEKGMVYIIEIDR